MNWGLGRPRAVLASPSSVEESASSVLDDGEALAKFRALVDREYVHLLRRASLIAGTPAVTGRLRRCAESPAT
jgi:hypothetical protein